MDIRELIRSKRDLIQRIATHHGARNVRVFGSVARGEALPESDVDLLVEAGPPPARGSPAGWWPTSKPCWDGVWTS